MKVVAAQETENRWIDLNYALRSAAFRMRAALLLSLLGKAGFRPDQPRVPAGVPEGGQWVDEGGDGDLIFVNDDPNRLPEIPKEPPPSTRERNRIGGAVARYLLATSLAAHADAVRHWVWDYARDRIIAYLDEPKFLDALQRAAIDPRPGYEIHHTVEQTPARAEGFSVERVDGWRNLVRIPTCRHWEITGWYGRRNELYGWMTPREYLRGKSWEEKYSVGLDAMRLHGVLK